MGNKSSTAASAPPPLSEAPLAINTSSTSAKPTTVPATPVSVATPATTLVTKTITTTPTTDVPTKTTTTAATVTTTTPTLTSTTTPVSVESTSKPTFYSLVKSVTSDPDKPKSASSAYTRWYKFSQFEQQKREKGKRLWYMGPSSTTTGIPSPTTSTLTMTTARIGSAPKAVPDPTEITAIPSFPLRSTAVYSPPHGDRVMPGRDELTNTDTSVFKYYLPENRSKETTGIHTKATMYNMNTLSRQTPLPSHFSPFKAANADTSTNVSKDNAPLPTFVSRGLQTDLQPQPVSLSTTETPHYNKQQTQIVPVSVLSNNTSSGIGFYHLPSVDTTNLPVSSCVEKTAVHSNDQLHSSAAPSFPSHLPSSSPSSILKNSSTVLSQDVSNPLLEATHEQILDELRKRNKNSQDGQYRVKKVHVLEKNEPDYHRPTVSFNLPQPTKANQSISRSERLFFSQSVNRKK